MAEPNEAEKLLQRLLDAIQRRHKLRHAIAGLLIATMLGLLMYFLWGLIPHQHTLKITGGEILGSRHLFVKNLGKSALKKHIDFIIMPVSGSFAALDKVNRGEIDLALIQGGLDAEKYGNVVHVATVTPEAVHFLAKPGIKSVEDLRGKTLNLGSKTGGTRISVNKILQFSTLEAGVDYTETNYSAEDLVSLDAEKLPDAVFILSTVPSYIVEHLVRNFGYQLLDLPFADSLALRYGWVSNEKIKPFVYSLTPPVPAKELDSIGVNMHLIANAKVDPRAIFSVLEALYSPQLASSMGVKIDPLLMSLPSGFPISQGTVDYANRDDPLLSMKTLDKLQNLAGFLMSLLATTLLILKWFRGPASQPSTQEDKT